MAKQVHLTKTEIETMGAELLSELVEDWTLETDGEGNYWAESMKLYYAAKDRVSSTETKAAPVPAPAPAAATAPTATDELEARLASVFEPRVNHRRDRMRECGDCGDYVVAGSTCWDTGIRH